MKRILVVWMISCVGLLVASSAAFAHHGTSAYEMTKTITLKGTITRFDFTNPHSMVYFDVKDNKGNLVHWVCETNPPGRAIRAGWTRDSLKPGDQVTITFNPAKNGAPVGFLQKVVLANGKVLGIKVTE